MANQAPRGHGDMYLFRPVNPMNRNNPNNNQNNAYYMVPVEEAFAYPPEEYEDTPPLYPGNPGFLGDQGFQGFQGFQGNQGNQGFVGNPGHFGNPGFLGNPGFQENPGFPNNPEFRGNGGFPEHSEFPGHPGMGNINPGGMPMQHPMDPPEEVLRQLERPRQLRRPDGLPIVFDTTRQPLNLRAKY